VSKKSLSAKILFKYLKSISLPVFTAIRPNLIYILAYHRIFPLPGKDYPFSEGTISATPEAFDQQMNFISKRFHVINFNVLSNAISSGKSIPKHSLIITFDDGYADNYEIAWSILKKHGLTATVFLATSFIDSGDLFWFDKLSYLIKSFSGNSITIGKYSFKTRGGRKKTIRESVMKIFRSVSEKERIRFYNELDDQCNNISLPSEDFELAKPLSWSQIKEMSKGGIEFGSHTVNHPFLSNLTNAEIMSELFDSKKVIEEKLGCKIKGIAYPSGYYDHRVINCAKDCGYQFGVSYEHNVKGFNSNELFNIPRIHVETDVDYNLFQANLLFPQLFVRFGAGGL
jgi:peptidoglycan/xylan/chitin deacetylase (PgdA/CDA1 family)